MIALPATVAALRLAGSVEERVVCIGFDQKRLTEKVEKGGEERKQV